MRVEFFTRQGADVRWVTDGPGLLPQLLKQLGREGKSADFKNLAECSSTVGSETAATLGSDQASGGKVR